MVHSREGNLRYGKVRSLVNAFRTFKSAASSLGSLDADSAATLVAAAADMALVIDHDGLVQDIAFNSDDLAKDLAHSADWIGRPWIETVTIESRVKIEQLLKEAVSKSEPRWRHVNHPVPGQPLTRAVDVPVLYSAVQAGARGRVVAFGRDLRPIASLQQRLMDAQQSMERDYSRLQHVETRYRLLFETSAEAVMILDAATHKVVEANPAARKLYGEGVKRHIGRPFDELFDTSGIARVQALLARVQTAGRGDEAAVPLAIGKRAVSLAASLFRQDNGTFFLVRLIAARGEADSATSKMGAKLLKILDKAPDGFVVTDSEGIVQTANAAFLEMIELGSEEQARAQSLERWLGRPGVDLSVLLANLRQRGTVRLFATTMRGELGTASAVEISAVAVANGQPSYGFAVRNVTRRLPTEQRPGERMGERMGERAGERAGERIVARVGAAERGRELPRSMEQLTELIGRVSLKELVREATDVVERMCIEAALELTGDNRASAAEMLGVSRQSLYVKLHRYGLGDLAESTGA